MIVIAALRRLRYDYHSSYTYNEKTIPNFVQTSDPPMQSSTPMHAQITISILCLARTPNAMLNKTHDAPLNLPNPTWYLEVTTTTVPQDVERCTTSLETNVSGILTSGLIHPSGSSFTKSRSMVMIPASHPFSFAAFHPFVVDVAVDALEV